MDPKIDSGVVRRIQEAELASQEDIQRARGLAQQEGRPVIFFLARMGSVDPEVVRKLLAEELGENFADLKDLETVELGEGTIDEKVAHLISGDTATEYNMIPIARNGSQIVLAMSDPSNLRGPDFVNMKTGLTPKVVLCDPHTISRRIQQIYNRTEENLGRLTELLEKDFQPLAIEEDKDEELKELEKLVAAAPVVDLLRRVIKDAVDRKASDIHFNPGEKELVIRIRVDGAMREVVRTAVRWARPITATLKLWAKLDPTQRRDGMDGNIKFKLENREIDFRLSTIPLYNGHENVVLRILDKSGLDLKLESLGLAGYDLQVIRRAMYSGTGMIILTGPTGSGKTTTLYSAMMELNTGEVNILTAENPVEYKLEGIQQLQVNKDHGVSFADALKYFMRQDPDIIMIGEIRDGDTAEMAVGASNTGHRILTTVHANDSATTFERMLGLGGVLPTDIANNVRVVIAQRLVRKICQRCAQPVTYTQEQLDLARVKPDEFQGATVMKGAGCPDCDNSGYSGRIALYEVLEVTPKIRPLIERRASASEILRAARLQGTRTLREQGLEKIRQGLTTLEEVIKTTEAPEDLDDTQASE